MEPMHSFEVDKIVKSIKTIQIKEIGTTIKFATKYQNVSRLNQQLINNMLQAGTGEYSDYIKEKLLDENKINELLKELISMEIWRTECLPIMFQTHDFKPDTTLPIEIGLAHEINILTILENVLFHSDSLESLEDRALDLIDYCHRQLNAVISAVSIGVPEESDSHQLKKNNLHIKLNEDKFRISALCLSIFFHMTNNLDAVPISAINRLLNKINLPQLLVEIVQIQPWTRGDKAFYDNAWNEIKDRRHVTKTEGMVYAILFNMIAKPEMFEKYEMSSTNVSSILKLNSYVGQQHVLEQFGFLTGLKAQLDYIQVQGDQFIQTHNKNSNCALIIELEPEIRDDIKHANPRVISIAADQMRFWMKDGKDFVPKFAAEINKAFDMDGLMKMEAMAKVRAGASIDTRAPPECGVCKKEAMKRCGACQLRWYCSAECQRGDWKKHKKLCKKIGS